MMYSAYKLNKQGDNIQPRKCKRNIGEGRKELSTLFWLWAKLPRAQWPRLWNSIVQELYNFSLGHWQVDDFWPLLWAVPGDLEKAMATHSSTLAWKIQWTEEPGRLQSMGSRGVAKSRTERLHFHFSLSCIGEGNGNPLQCSCLENPRDGGAGWAAIYGVTQGRTRLKRLSSSTSSNHPLPCLHLFCTE